MITDRNDSTNVVLNKPSRIQYKQSLKRKKLVLEQSMFKIKKSCRCCSMIGHTSSTFAKKTNIGKITSGDKLIDF